MNKSRKQSVLLQISSLKSLPALPEESIKILQAINDPDISIAKLSDALVLSPGLVARLLGLANSAYFGQSRQITDLHTAIVQVLGLQLVKSLTMTIVLQVQLDNHACKGFDTKVFWTHSLLTAIGAQKLATFFRPADISISTVYTSGLLLYIGFLVAAHLYPKEFEQILVENQTDYIELGKAVSQHLGLSHYQMGYMLLHKWQLPDIFQDILQRFEDTELKVDVAKHIHILRASQTIVCAMLEEETWNDESLQQLADALMLPLDQITSVVDELTDKKQDIEQLAEIMRA